MKKNLLGRTGLWVSEAGFGALPIGPSQRALPVSEGAALLRRALDAGINFIDTAQYYQTYPYIREALAGRSDKSDIVISSKSLCADYEGMWLAIEEARKELDREVIDIFLMHEVRSGQIPHRMGAFQALIEAREKGLVRAIGLSTHHVDIAESAASIPELDVVFPLINYAGLGIRRGNEFASCTEMETAIRACSQAGKGVFAMKAFGGGALTGNYQKALNYVFGLPEIQSVMIGFGAMSEIDDILAYLDGSMPPDYNPDISQKRVRISQDDCEGCGACKAACPNSAVFYNQNGLAEIDQTICLTCGYCAPVCPVRAIIMY